ncbi:terpene synthase-like isoform X2 [Temnothorax nylanderi]|uniref:terpene synthase-like isoform X2 n=1 Tax=Temnothorax nylanderi TaxID=102681 RepID=UPI003A864D9D
MTDQSKDTPFYYSQSGDTEEDKKLLEPLKYIVQCTEKHRCTKLTSVFNHWLQISHNQLQQIDDIIRIVYNTCILYDDVQDNSILRDGIPVTHNIYGLSGTISATNYAQFIAVEKALHLHPEAVKILTEHILEFNRGQGMDMYWKNNLMCPTENDYKMMAERKAGWLIKLMANLMKLFSKCEIDLSLLLNLMGFYYQIHNDYTNLCVCKDPNDKSFCDDLTEGKFSFPIIHALKYDDDREIINILKQRTTDTKIKCYCVSLLEKFGSLKYTRDTLKELNKKIRIEIDRLGGNEKLVKMLNEYENEVPYTSTEAESDIVC